MKNRKANWIVTLVTGFSLSILLFSCEPYYDYPYVMTNNTDTLIEVHYKLFSFDSVVYVEKDSTKLLFVENHGVGGGGPSFRDVNKDLKSFYVIKNSVTSNRNYLENDAWTFTVLNKQEGQYKTTVTNAEF